MVRTSRTRVDTLGPISEAPIRITMVFGIWDAEALRGCETLAEDCFEGSLVVLGCGRWVRFLILRRACKCIR